MALHSPKTLLLVALTGLIVASNVSAAPPLTLGEVTRRIESSGERVLAAERKRHKGQPMYRLKVLTPQGRVRKLWVDPRSGRRAR